MCLCHRVQPASHGLHRPLRQMARLPHPYAFASWLHIVLAQSRTCRVLHVSADAVLAFWKSFSVDDLTNLGRRDETELKTILSRCAPPYLPFARLDCVELIMVAPACSVARVSVAHIQPAIKALQAPEVLSEQLA